MNQPRDVSAIIDRIAKQSAAKGPLDGRVDLERIAVVGHSLGGLTATLSTFHVGLRDPRLAAAASIRGPFTFYTPRFFEGATLRFLANPDRVGCFALDRLLDLSDTEELLHRLGGAESGLDSAGTAHRPCEKAPPSRTMDPLRQQAITRLAVAAYLEAQFAADSEARRAAAEYLAAGLQHDFPEARFEGTVADQVGSISIGPFLREP
ncbi:MAG: hypothetical protein GY725_06650 [bacterium]|nr:hypothetical protein [bacterium]